MFFALSAISLASWLYLTFGRRMYWRLARKPELTAAPPGKRIIAVIPARNEADVIGRAVRSLLHQQLPEPLHVVVVDDNSTDGTAAQVAALESERVTLTRGRPLEEGWTGKLWALHQGVELALKQNPDYLLLTDADIEHASHSIGRLLTLAKAEHLDLASYMVRLRTDTLAEKLLIPAFVYFFFQLYPPASQTGSAGGCVLIRPEALAKAGGIEAIRRELIDDCALAQRVRKHGGKLHLELTNSSRSLRSYGSWDGVGRMISRSAFAQLQHSYILLAGTLAGLALVYLVPPIAALGGRGKTRLFGATGWTLMTFTYRPFTTFFGRAFFAPLELPLAALFYGGATVHSAWAYAQGRGGVWKGRVQDASQERT